MHVGTGWFVETTSCRLARILVGPRRKSPKIRNRVVTPGLLKVRIPEKPCIIIRHPAG